MIVKKIDKDACTKCGECARICANSKVIDMGDGGYPRFERDLMCIHCGHCLAICPAGAISFEFRGEDPSGDFVVGAREFGEGSTGPEFLLRTLDSMRSCRYFDGRPVEEAKLERVLETMVRSPSAGNEQNRNFYVFATKEKVDALDAATAGYYRVLNAQMTSPLALWFASNAAAGKDYSRIWIRNRASVDLPKARRKEAFRMLFESLKENDERRYFFNSSAAILVTSRTNAIGMHKSFYKADVEIAITHGTLAAAALGLASCRMGLTEIAFGKDKSLREKYGIPPNERVDGIVALGYSKLQWKRMPPRGPVTVKRM